MEELFITKIHIHEVRHLKDFDIPLSETERKHLILTGRNGSGKTSVLEAINDAFMKFGIMKVEAATTLDQQIANPETFTIPGTMHSMDLKSMFYQVMLGEKVGIEISNTWEKFMTGIKSDFQLLFFPARRGGAKFETPKVIEKVTDFKGSNFLKYLLNLTADRAFALEEKDPESAKKTSKWLEDFKITLQHLYGDPALEFDFNRKDYHYYIKQDGRNPVHFNQLPDGFSAIMEILTELLMRIEKIGKLSNEICGIVLIDEIETHLHIDLQKKVLPFLISFFPKIQFIVTTHSPFVLTSVHNAVIFDLEKRQAIEDLSDYSYNAIVKSYFDTDEYSEVLKKEVAEYETLMSSESLSVDQEDRLDELDEQFDNIPKFFSDPLIVKIQQIRLKNLKKAH